MPPRPSLPEIFLVALRLGCTSFGGPIAHLAFFRTEYVEKRRWLSEVEYADLVALCQFLPGPASSQTGFGVGYLQRGLIGGLAAWLGFTLPSAALMIGFALGLGALGDLRDAGWLHGLKIAAVAVVAQAVWAMSRSLCPDWPRRALALGAAALVVGLPWAAMQIGVIAAGAVAGWILFRPITGGGVAHTAEPTERWNPASGRVGGNSTRENASGGRVPPVSAGSLPHEAPRPSRSLAYLGIFAVLLVGLPLLAALMENPKVELVDKFYRAGSLVFGGGHVVLPLLEREAVGLGGLTRDHFLAGYGAAQAVPGPLFTLSAYLGAVITGDARGGGLALLAIFLPALLLVAGVLPLWQSVRERPALRAAMHGANAAVVGVLLAALIHPVGTAAITDLRSLTLALAAFVALQLGRVPVWAVVPALAALGAWVV